MNTTRLRHILGPVLFIFYSGIISTSCGLFVFDMVEEMEVSKVSAESGKLQRFFLGSGQVKEEEPAEMLKFMEAKDLGPVKAIHLRLSELFIVNGADYIESPPPLNPSANSAEASLSQNQDNDALAQALGLPSGSSSNDIEQALSTMLGGEEASWLDVIGNVFGLPEAGNTMDTRMCPNAQNFNFMVRTEIMIDSMDGQLPTVQLGLLEHSPDCRTTLEIKVNDYVDLADYYGRGMIVRTRAKTLAVPEDIYFSGRMIFRVEMW